MVRLFCLIAFVCFAFDSSEGGKRLEDFHRSLLDTEMKVSVAVLQTTIIKTKKNSNPNPNPNPNSDPNPDQCPPPASAPTQPQTPPGNPPVNPPVYPPAYPPMPTEHPTVDPQKCGYDFDATKKFCTSEGGIPWTMTSKWKLDLLKPFLNLDGLSGNPEEFWLGAERKSANHRWRWLQNNDQPSYGLPAEEEGDRVNPTFLQWYADTNGSCLVMETGNGGQPMLHDANCNKRFPSAICEIEGHRFNKRIYNEYRLTNVFIKVKQPGASYVMAKEQCDKFGGHLATPTSTREMRLIDSLVEEIGPEMTSDALDKARHYWVGGRRVKFNGRKKWISGEPIVPGLRPFRMVDDGGRCLHYTVNAKYDSSINQMHTKYFDFDKCNARTNGYICQRSFEG